MKINKTQVFVGLVILVAAYFVAQPLFASMKGSVPESTNFTRIATEREFDSIIENAGSRLIVLDLYADWCGPCRVLHPTLLALANKYAGKASFYRVNVDANPKIAAAFGTNGIPYVVFVKDRKAIESLVGVNPSKEYEKIIIGTINPNGQQKAPGIAL